MARREIVGKRLLAEFEPHAARDDAAADRRRGRDAALSRASTVSISCSATGSTTIPVSTRLDRQGAAGSSARSSRPSARATNAHVALGEPGFDEGMAHAMLFRRLQARAEVAEIVGVGAGDDRAFEARGDRAVEIVLAEIAAVDGVGAIARVGKLAGVDRFERPAFLRGVRAHALAWPRRGRPARLRAPCAPRDFRDVRHARAS